MKPHGLLFTGEMILPLLNTKPDVWPAEPIDASLPFKWQTRRGMKPQPYFSNGQWQWDKDKNSHHLLNPDGSPTIKGFEAWQQAVAPHPVGQVIYARETWKPHCEGEISEKHPLGTCIKYRADGAMIKPTDWTAEEGFKVEAQENMTKWKPGIHMPKFAARLWFIVKRVRFEQVNQISEADALAEGISWPDRDGKPYRPPIDLTGMSKLRLAAERYEELFDSINGEGAFRLGVWTIAYDLQRISKTTASIICP